MVAITTTVLVEVGGQDGAEATHGLEEEGVVGAQEVRTDVLEDQGRRQRLEVQEQEQRLGLEGLRADRFFCQGSLAKWTIYFSYQIHGRQACGIFCYVNIYVFTLLM